MATYYDGTRLLSQTDINGNRPEIYMCTANNTAGKTTFFSRMIVNKFMENKGKFMLVYRFNYELDECADKFYRDISDLFFNGTVMTQKKRASGSFIELYINDRSCGYAVSLNNVDNIKKYSHFFNDTRRMFMDEFQSETDNYCSNEVNKFRALHKAVARGHGEMVRYVPVYMCANPITILNPYYVKMGISTRINSKTKFLKGDGWILEQGFNEDASRAQKESGFNRAFGNDTYSKFTSDAVYLNDNYAFVESPQGFPKYICTIRFENTDYAVKEFANLGIVYCDTRVDSTFPVKISVTTEDHQINYVMLKNNDYLLSTLRYFFRQGCFRFKDIKCKEAILNALSY